MKRFNLNAAALIESARVGADSLRTNTMRTTLSTTGVIIGVAALVARVLDNRWGRPLGKGADRTREQRSGCGDHAADSSSELFSPRPARRCSGFGRSADLSGDAPKHRTVGSGI